MLVDPFAGVADSIVAPASNCFVITPDDTNDLTIASKAVFVGTGGDLVLRPIAGDEDVTFRNVPDGSVLDVRVRAIRASGTTASDLIGLV